MEKKASLNFLKCTFQNFGFGGKIEKSEKLVL